MNKASSIVLAICIALLFVAWKPYAERPTSGGEVENTGFQFVANKGQWNNNIRFMTDVPNGRLYLGKAGFSYVFQHPDDLAKLGGHGKIAPEGGVMRSHIFKIDFVGASGNRAEGARAYTEYHNYYHGNDRSAWASRVPLYREVQYPEIYSNIDMNIYGDDFQLKYDLVINTGGDIQDIKMKYTGVDQLHVKEGKLHIVTSVNEIIEQEPYAFQRIDGQLVKVKCKFVVDGDVVTFLLPNGYDSTHQLIIDPKLIFSTFSGSLTDNWGFTATFDFDGQVYSGGIAFGPNWQNIIGDTTFLPTVGAFQDSFAGGTFYPCDMGIIKYTASGASRIYSTYLGGAQNECPHSLVATPSGDLLILGTTGSSNFPTTILAYDSTFNGGSSIISSSSIEYPNGSDIVVAKLSFDGTALAASTYIGGTGNDGLNIDNDTRYNYGDDFRGEIIVDGSGDCYVATTTASSNFPMVNGFQSTYGGGITDGVSFKLSSNFSTLIWSSYLGGANADAAYAVQFDQSNDVYVCGGTTSTDFPTTGGALNPSFLGDVDGFVVHISSNGSNLVGSTYIGTPQYDQTYFVQLDTAENVYVVGQTMGTYSIIPDSIIGTIYSNAGGKQYIHKLNNALSETAFSTVYGTGGPFPDISPSAFLVNNCGNIFVSGWGGATGTQQGSTFGLPTTSNAEQLSTDGNDFHLLVLFKDAVSLLYATFFGGPISNEHVDGGTSRFDKNGIVYQSVCGGCGGNSDYPTTPGVWSNTNNSSNCNNAVFKFDMSDIAAKFNVLPQDEGCVPFNATFQNLSTGGLTYYWDYGDGTTSNLFDDSHLYLDTGVYDVLLVITDSTTCQVQDSAFATVTVHPLPTPVTSPDTSVCPGGSVTLTASGGTTYIWSPASTLSCQICASPDASPNSYTQYTVNIIDDNGCQITDTINVAILPTPNAIAGLDLSICPGNSVQLSAVGGVAYSWSPDSTLDIPSLPNPVASPSVTTDYIVTVFDLNGCSDDDTLTVTVQDSIVAEAGQPAGICLGDSVPLLASGGATYSWSPAAGLSDPNIANPMASPSVTTWYTVNVSSGTCGDFDSVQVLVNPPPIADAGPDVTICEGDTATLTGSGGSVIIWNSVDSIATIWVSPDSTSTYTVLIQDFIGCSDTDIVTVNVKAPPIIIVSPDTTICAGEPVLLVASGGDTYLWSTGKPGSTLTVSPTDTTEYYVIGYDTSNCWGTDTVVVNVMPEPSANAGIVADGGCEPFTVNFVNNSTPEDSSLTYLWNFGDPISGILNVDSLREPSHTYNNAGTYLVTMTLDHAICSGSSSMTTSTTVTVNAIPNAAIEAIPDQVSMFDPSVFIVDNSSGGTSCILVFPNGDTLVQCDGEYTITDTGLVTIMQIVYDGTCTDTAYADVYVKPEYIFFAPNTFSPNGDGFNDFFYGQGIGIKSYHMFIYDRWGDNLFESRDRDLKWDGKANEGDHIVQQDVYVYVFKVTDFLNFPHTYIGHVTVIR